MFSRVIRVIIREAKQTRIRAHKLLRVDWY